MLWLCYYSLYYYEFSALYIYSIFCCCCFCCYYTGDYQPSLEALAIGLPVVTWPSQTHIGGRLTLALYYMLGYGYQTQDPSVGDNAPADPSQMGETTSSSNDPEASYSPLVVASAAEYVSLAIRLTHQPKLRQFHSERILRRRHRLFQQDHRSVLAQWR